MAASENEVVYEEVTKGPVCKMIGGIPAMMNNLQKELLSVIDRSNLEMTQLSFSFSSKIGTLSLDMSSHDEWQGNTVDDERYGSYGGPRDSGGSGKSRRRRRERRAAQRNNATTNSISIINIHKPTNRFIRLLYRKRFRKII